MKRKNINKSKYYRFRILSLINWYEYLHRYPKETNSNTIISELLIYSK